MNVDYPIGQINLLMVGFLPHAIFSLFLSRFLFVNSLPLSVRCGTEGARVGTG